MSQVGPVARMIGRSQYVFPEPSTICLRCLCFITPALTAAHSDRIERRRASALSVISVSISGESPVAVRRIAHRPSQLLLVRLQQSTAKCADAAHRLRLRNERNGAKSLNGAYCCAAVCRYQIEKAARLL